MNTQNIQTEDLAITIKTIRVDGKKMTMALFKQIPQRALSPDDFNNPLVKIFGNVLYELDSFCQSWLVLADNGRLMRVGYKAIDKAYVNKYKEPIERAQEALAKSILEKAHTLSLFSRTTDAHKSVYDGVAAREDKKIEGRQEALNYEIRMQQWDAQAYEYYLEAIKFPQLYIAVG